MNAEKFDKAIELRNKIDKMKNFIDGDVGFSLDREVLSLKNNYCLRDVKHADDAINECYIKLRSLCENYLHLLEKEFEEL